MRKLEIVLNCFICGLLLVAISSCGGTNGVDNPVDPTPTKPVITPSVGMDLYGFIGDAKYNPIEGVVVSDGYQCVKTDSKGIYQMKRNTNGKFVFYSIPADCAVNTQSTVVKTARFYTKLSTDKRYDFTLAKLSGGIERNFNVIAIGDPQVSTRANDPYYNSVGSKISMTNLNRFKNETMADIKTTIAGISGQVYGISMGDETDTGAYTLQSSVHDAMGSTSMIAFSVIGNHDHYGTKAAYDEIGVNAYENAWGPINYSFNRGNVHFIVMDDVLFPNSADLSNYIAGFTDEQVVWMKQDLSFVPKSMMVILCYHIPLRNTACKNRDAILSLMSGYANTALFCGHTHYHEVGDITKDLTTTEHVHAAACGAWWKSNMNTEGTPNGYQVYSISGTDFVNWYYKSVGFDKSYQMRLSEADYLYGGNYGYYDYCDQLMLTKKVGYVVADIYNADSKWTIKAYEGTSKTGVTMTKATNALDAYAMGYHVGVLNRNPDSYGGSNKHTYYYKRIDVTSPVTVVATDEFGNEYKATSFTTDFDSVQYYK